MRYAGQAPAYLAMPGVTAPMSAKMPYPCSPNVSAVMQMIVIIPKTTGWREAD